MKKDFLKILDYTRQELLGILGLAAKLKSAFKRGKNPDTLKNKSVVMIFEKPSLRTRVTFETAITQLGGHVIYLSPETIQLGKRETVEDVGRNLERWVDAVVMRTFSHDTVVKMAKNCSVPVINALTDFYHPCQAIATGLTLQETFDRLQGLRVAFIGDGNNVANSLLALCARLGIPATMVCPEGYEPPAGIWEMIQDAAQQSRVKIALSHDPRQGVHGANFIYTDVWTSMGQEDQAATRKPAFQPFQVNYELLRFAAKGCRVSHCLPAHRGEEITSEVLDSNRSLAFDEAENRLHVQKAVLVKLIAQQRQAKRK